MLLVVFLQVIGDTFGYNKSTVSRVIHAVTNEICCHGADFLRWSTDNERAVIMNGFYQIAQFPCAIGAVDGTHIRIQAPTEDDYAFVNRKNYHSINVQGICDHEGKQIVFFLSSIKKWSERQKTKNVVKLK